MFTAACLCCWQSVVFLPEGQKVEGIVAFAPRLLTVTSYSGVSARLPATEPAAVLPL